MKKEVRNIGKERTITRGNVIVSFRYILLAVFFFFPLSLTFASSGASFLKIPVGARAVGMGGAYTAVVNDLSALHWNPAGLSGIEKKEVSLTYALLVAETRFSFVGFGMPVNSVSSGRWNIGVGALYLSQGAIEGRDEYRHKTEEFSANDLAINFGASRAITKRSSLGMNIKVLRQSVESEKANGWAVDCGVLTKTQRLNLGLALQNIGPSMKFMSESFSLPLTLAGGAGYHLKSGLTFSFDVKHQINDRSTSVGFGGELPLLNLLSLRAGYLSTLSSLQKSDENRNSLVKQFSGIAAGFGFKIRNMQMDYAFTPSGELGSSQRISFALSF